MTPSFLRKWHRCIAFSGWQNELGLTSKNRFTHMLSLTLFVFAALCVFFPGTRLTAAPVDILPSALRGAAQPQVAVAPGGRIHIAFGKGNAIYHTGSADGRVFSLPVKVAELPKLALGMRRGPRIVATDKVIAITAISHASGDLVSWNSTDGGATWKEGAKLNSAPKSAGEGLHAMAGDGQGNVFATWLDLRSGGTELWGAASQDGGASWSPNALIYHSPDGHICECCHPNVAMDATGRVAVMWRNWLGGSRDLYLVTRSDRGKTFGPARKLGEGTWKLDGCPMDGGSIAINPSGEVLTAWRREKTVFASSATTPEQRLAEGSQALVLSTSKDTLYFWESAGGLMIRRNDAQPARLADRAHMAAAALLPKGGVIVVWESTADGVVTLLAETLP